jgi:hypothetical protein
VTDFVPAYEVSEWYGIGAPKNAPAAIIERLNSESHQKIPQKSKHSVGFG